MDGGGNTAAITGYTPIIGDMTKWKAAKARGAANPARFMSTGDSNFTGTGSGTGTNNMVGAALTGMARQFANLQGFRIDSAFGNQNATGGGVTLPQYDARITQGAGCLLSTTP